MEQTDESIREALRNLPPDLSTTYDRILRRSEYRRGHSYQRQILSFLLAALRPLEMNELREALAVVPGDTKWKPDNQVNNIYHTLTCCESLVIVAEEEHTVHFVHQSVAQFLLDQKSTSTTLRFDLAQASLELGEVCVTYLNYAIFDQRLSTNVVPAVPTSVIPANIAQDTLKGSGLVGQLALKLLNLQSTDGPDIGKVLAETSRLHRKRQESAAFEFLKYASQHWLIHTVRIDDKRSTFSLWKGLLQNPQFDGLVWSPNDIHPDKLVVDEQSGNIWTLPTSVTWAISHSHLPLLLLELRGRRGLKAFCSIIPYIQVLVRSGDRLKVDGTMALKLFEVAVVAKADDAANLLLQSHQTTCSRETFLEPFVKRSDLASVGWVISLESFGSLDGLKFPIVEFACRARNLQLLNLALDLGASVYTFDHNPLVSLIGEMRDSLDLALACRLLKAGFRLEGCERMQDRLYWFLRYYTLVNDPDNFDPHQIIVDSESRHHSRISTATCDGLIQRACSNGDLQMVQKLLNKIDWLSFEDILSTGPETYFLWMAGALQTYSTDRRGIVQLLGEFFEQYLKWIGEWVGPGSNTDQWHSMWLKTFRRCLQLRAWELAETVRRIPYLQAASFRMILMKFNHSNKKRGGHDKHSNAGDATQLGSGTACGYQGQPMINADDSAKKAVMIDEYEETVFETSNHVSLIHLTASCGDVSGTKLLLDVLGSEARPILSASSPLNSCFGGDVPLQTLLTQEQSTIEDTANFLRVADMILQSIGAHGISACGRGSKSCIELTPWFCVKAVQSIIRGGRDVLSPDSRPYSFEDDLGRNQCLSLLEEFLRTWLAHIPPSANLRRLLSPMLDAIGRGFGEVKAELETPLPHDKTNLEPILEVHFKDYMDLWSKFVHSLGVPGLKGMLEFSIVYGLSV